jgi:predicted nuclease with RNAse H fold
MSRAAGVDGFRQVCDAAEMRNTATFGVDLAAQPNKTAVCLIEWREDGRGWVDCPSVGATDSDILALLANEFVTVTAIDAPFGWPTQFTESITSYTAAGVWPDAPGEQSSQDSMRLRGTDRVVHDETKLTPLSVSTDKIGIVAMRAARLLAAHWEATSQPADRSGLGDVVEVYPAAALVQWGVSQRAGVSDPGTYKGKTAAAQTRRVRIIDAIATAAPWLEIDEKVRVVCIDSDDCLDALVCALVARASELNRVLPVLDHAAAQAEGWIRLPQPGSLESLGPSRV